MKRILMADDDKYFRSVVARFLESAGYAAETAGNGEEAIAAALAHQPDMLILDVALPLVTGDEVARRLEGRFPILFISGRDLDRLEGLSGDRYRYMRKPADLDEILATVRELLGEPTSA